MIADEQSREERMLVAAFLRTRSERHFRRLYRQQTPRMLRLAGRIAAGAQVGPDDVVQEAWMRAVDALPRFEWRSSLASWLGGFVINVVREQRRSARPRSAPSDASKEVDWSDPLVRLDLTEALQTLPPGFRSVLSLHDIAGFTHEEIGEILGIEPGTSKSQLARARERMRTLINVRHKD